MIFVFCLRSCVNPVYLETIPYKDCKFKAKVRMPKTPAQIAYVRVRITCKKRIRTPSSEEIQTLQEEPSPDYLFIFSKWWQFFARCRSNTPAVVRRMPPQKTLGAWAHQTIKKHQKNKHNNYKAFEYSFIKLNRLANPDTPSLIRKLHLSDKYVLVDSIQYIVASWG